MELIEGVALSELCDYSFGDQAGQWSGIYTHFMKDANLTNTEFVNKVFEIKKSRDYMTLFIDNIRLYNRKIDEVKPEDWPVVRAMMQKSNLLSLCSNFIDMKFIIFTNLEDTPLDKHILTCLPNNVTRVIAVNSVVVGNKVIPAPYGVQRRMSPSDDRIEVLKSYMDKDNKLSPRSFRLLYVGVNENSHEERKGLTQQFINEPWASVETQRVDFETYLDRMWRCKFVLCPRGNAIDCHRNWETIYMRRVPVMKRTPFLEELYKDYQVLFVDNYSEVTEQLLIDNNQMFLDAQTQDLSKLDLNNFFETWKKP
tara:strand:+ start:5324 stop:6256 length:933 start_codon:yes stop_codon:yes gene_type:complete